MKAFLDKDLDENENVFDRCMEVTKRSRNYYKEAMRREEYYRNTMMEMGIENLLNDGYLTEVDLTDLRDEVRETIIKRHNYFASR